ncbi:MAG: adenylate/guanylate cyclase domain-containing protein [Pseudomonadota bacterium]
MSDPGTPHPSIAVWLEAAGLESLRAVFEEEEITCDVLGELDDDDLRELGLKLGQRKKFHAALRAGSASIPAAQPAVVEDLPADTAESVAAEPRGERRQLTVVFVDLVGSTDLSRRLDPEEMSELLHRYQDAVSGTVARMGGHVDKFLGDGVVAFFGWPLAREDAVEQAVHASLSIVSQVAALKAPQGETLGCRVGIATGLVVVRADGEVMGETPNLAARLQSIAAPGAVVISGTTAALTRGIFAANAIKNADLKGFPDGTDAFEVTDARHGVSRFEAKGQRDLMPIVGRQAELDTLGALWEEVRAGHGVAVRIEGEAGIGKSRLLAALKAMVPSGERFVVNYQCSTHYADVPLWAVGESLRQTYSMSGSARAPDEHRARLTERLETVGNITPGAPTLMAQLIGVDAGPDPEIDALDARSRRSRTLEMLLRQVECMSAIKPLLIVLEDAHWADPTTLEYLDRIIANKARLPIYVVITSRGGDVLEGADWSARLHLERLGRAESRAMISEMLQDTMGVEGAENAVSADLVESLTARGEGIPLFIEELTRGLMMARKSNRAVARADIPVTLHDLLMARLDRLGSAKAVAQSAACIGREFSVDLLSQTLDQSAASVSVALADLTEAGVIVPAPAIAEGDFAFYHALIRDAAYESLLIRDRQALHGRILTALDAMSDVRPELIAQHAQAAGDLTRAGDELLQAGKRAGERWANKEALQLLNRALSVIAQWDTGEARALAEIECRLARGDALGAIHGYAAPEVRENYEAARLLCEDAGQTELLFNALRGLWNGIYNTGGFAESLPVAERMHSLAEQTGEVIHWVAAQRSLGSNYLSLNRFDAASAAYRDCIRRGADLPDGAATSYGELPLAVAHGMLSQLEAFAARLDTALDLVQRSDAIARANGHPLAINQALAIVGIIHWLRQEPKEALKAAEEEARLATSYGYVHWKAHSDVMIGACEARLGNANAGLKRLASGIDAWIGTGARSYAPVFYGYLADCAHDAGADDIAAKAVEDGLALAKSSGEYFALAELQRLAAKLAPTHEAPALLAQALETAESQGATLYLLRSLCDALDLPGGTAPELRSTAQKRLTGLMTSLQEHTTGPELRRASDLLQMSGSR